MSAYFSSVARSPMRAPAQLRVKNRMRLLPDEKRPDGRRRFRAAGTGHFRPARAGVALFLRRAFGARQNFLVPAEAFFQQRQPVPQREMRLVPPVHFQMKFALPSVVRQPGFRRRIFARILDGREVLRQARCAVRVQTSAGPCCRTNQSRRRSVQNWFQCFCAAGFVSANVGKALAGRFFRRKGADKFQVRPLSSAGEIIEPMFRHIGECCARRPARLSVIAMNCPVVCPGNVIAQCITLEQADKFGNVGLVLDENVSCASGWLQSAVFVSPVP